MKKTKDEVSKWDEAKFAPTNKDTINPDHYKMGGVEVIDAIEAWDLNFRLANVVKYVARAGKKSTSPLEDLKKAQWYLNREISKVRS